MVLCEDFSVTYQSEGVEDTILFMVDEAAAEQSRCLSFEISPTGPLYGYRMSSADGWPGQLEADVLAAQRLTLDDFRAPDAHRVKGGRRPLRFPIADLEVRDGNDRSGYLVELKFVLPPGCYATAVLREILKADDVF